MVLLLVRVIGIGIETADMLVKEILSRNLLLRLGRRYPGKKTWGPAYMKWLRSQKLEHREQRMALEELLEGVRQEDERVERLEQAIREAVSEWSLGERREKQAKVAAAPRSVREIAWKAQTRLRRRFPVSGAQRQAANGRRHGGRSRASGVRLGDQSRSHSKSSDDVVRGCGPLESCARPAHSPSVAIQIK